MQSLADDAAGAQAPAADAGSGGGGGEAALHGKTLERAKKADDYHAQHPDWVAQFNALTNGECAGGTGGVKWAAVRAWQQKHSVKRARLKRGRRLVLFQPSAFCGATSAARKPQERCEPSQNGFFRDAPQRHSAITSLPGGGVNSFP